MPNRRLARPVVARTEPVSTNPLWFVIPHNDLYVSSYCRSGSHDKCERPIARCPCPCHAGETPGTT
jgi:hypothetical protein